MPGGDQILTPLCCLAGTFSSFGLVRYPYLNKHTGHAGSPKYPNPACFAPRLRLPTRSFKLVFDKVGQLHAALLIGTYAGENNMGLGRIGVETFIALIGWRPAYTAFSSWPPRFPSTIHYHHISLRAVPPGGLGHWHGWK